MSLFSHVSLVDNLVVVSNMGTACTEVDLHAYVFVDALQISICCVGDKR